MSDSSEPDRDEGPAAPPTPSTLSAEAETLLPEDDEDVGPRRSAEPSSSEVLQELGRYVVLGTLGSGGMGTVLEAFDRVLDRKVAVKVLHRHLDERHTRRLLREAQALAKLSHPNVVQVYEVGDAGGRAFVAMEMVEGQTLAEWMKREPRPGWREQVEVFLQLGRGLAAAHAQDLVHRDFKPGNAIIDASGRARVLDFGLARRTDVEGEPEEEPSEGPELDLSTVAAPSVEGSRSISSGTVEGRVSMLEESLTRTGSMMGTPAYMSLEQVSGADADARSDQYSFCVSLYEALHGERPYVGETFAEQVAAMMEEAVAPAPPGTTVPRSVRRVVLRGLASDPEQRWPSMDALLDELQQLVSPRRPSWRVWLPVTIVAAAGIVVAYRVGVGEGVDQRCTGAEAQLREVWGEGRTQEVRAAIEGTELPFAADTWVQVETRLDAYATRWAEQYTEACQATMIRQEQSDEVMALRMACLREHQTALRATVDLLAAGDARVVEKAVSLVESLPPSSRCAEVERLFEQRQRVPPPDEPEVAAEVEDSRRRLADVRAAQVAGDPSGAMEQVEPIVERAASLGYEPLEAEAALARGAARSAGGRYADAEEDLLRAYELAAANGHESVELGAARALASVIGISLERHDEGLQWGAVALPLAHRIGDPTDVAATMRIQGSLLGRKGRYEEAQEHIEQALRILEEALGEDHMETATTVSRLGSLLRRRGEYQAARDLELRALGINERVLGAEHPAVARSAIGVGNAAYVLGDFEEAELQFRRAAAILERALGPEHPTLAAVFNNLGAVLTTKGDLEGAKAEYQRALTISEKALGPEHPGLADPINNLGAISVAEGKHEDARVYYRRALDIREKALGPEHPDVAQCLDNLGGTFQLEGRYADAEPLYERALRIYEEAHGVDHPKVGRVLGSLAFVELMQGRLEPARAKAERAISIFEGRGETGELLGNARFVLARALGDDPAQRERAVALARAALEALAAGGPRRPDQVAAIEAWLAEHEEG